jgi:flagellin-like protein
LRRGVSELVSAVILIAIVLSATVLYIFFFSRSSYAGVRSFRDIMAERMDQSNEMLSILYSSYSNGEINIYIYNYGYRDVKINRIYVGDQEPSYTLVDAWNGQNVNVMQRGRPYILRISYSLNGGASVTIITDSNKVYTVRINV